MHPEFDESLRVHFKLMKILETHNLLITESNNGNRRAIFYDFLESQTFFLFHNSENSSVVVIDNLKSLSDIYSAYQNNNGKLIVFDTEKLFSRKNYMVVADVGFCSSPDSSKKWPVRYEGKKDFIFKGHVVILCPFKKSELNSKSIFEYALRDMAII